MPSCFSCTKLLSQSSFPPTHYWANVHSTHKSNETQNTLLHILDGWHQMGVKTNFMRYVLDDALHMLCLRKKIQKEVKASQRKDWPPGKVGVLYRHKYILLASNIQLATATQWKEATPNTNPLLRDTGAREVGIQHISKIAFYCRPQELKWKNKWWKSSELTMAVRWGA